MAGTINVDLSRLTLDELEEFESIVGDTAANAFAGGLTIKAIKALVYITQRRTNPDFTLADTGSLTMADLEIGDGALDPTDAAS